MITHFRKCVAVAIVVGSIRWRSLLSRVCAVGVKLVGPRGFARASGWGTLEQVEFAGP